MEKELCRYQIIYQLQDKLTEVEVQVIDMGGWLLYDCFLLPTQDLIQIIFDNGIYNVVECSSPEMELHVRSILQILQTKLEPGINLPEIFWSKKDIA